MAKTLLNLTRQAQGITFMLGQEGQGDASKLTLHVGSGDASAVVLEAKGAAIFDGNITTIAPTIEGHVATKGYVDTIKNTLDNSINQAIAGVNQTISEIPSTKLVGVNGTKDGQNVVFGFTQELHEDSFQLYLNGMLLSPYSGEDYTVDYINKTVTLAFSPEPEDRFVAYGSYVGSSATEPPQVVTLFDSRLMQPTDVPTVDSWILLYGENMDLTNIDVITIGGLPVIEYEAVGTDKKALTFKLPSNLPEDMHYVTFKMLDGSTHYAYNWLADEFLYVSLISHEKPLTGITLTSMSTTFSDNELITVNGSGFDSWSGYVTLAGVNIPSWEFVTKQDNQIQFYAPTLNDSSKDGYMYVLDIYMYDNGFKTIYHSSNDKVFTKYAY
jgi:hypothetical protein